MAGTKNVIWLQYCIHLVAMLGVIISFYALFVELEKEANPDYVPFCDFSEVISCTKAFMSRWGRGMGLVEIIFGKDSVLNQRNPVYGVFIYSFVIILGFFTTMTALNILVGICIVLNLTSAYLAYILYTEVQSLCLICTSIYVVNFLLLVLTVWRRSALIPFLKKMKRR